LLFGCVANAAAYRDRSGVFFEVPHTFPAIYEQHRTLAFFFFCTASAADHLQSLAARMSDCKSSLGESLRK
jgi:hypothetical protein